VTSGLSADDAALAASDLPLAGLATVLDPARMTAALAAQLPGRRVEAFEGLYVRYRPEKTCTVMGTVAVDGERHPVSVRTAPRGRLGSLAAIVERSSAATGVGVPGLLLEDVPAAVLAYPNDRRLPLAAELDDPAAGPALVSRLVPGADAPDARAHIVRWHPEQRIVARVDVAGAPYAAVKVLLDGQAGGACAAIGAFASSGSLRVPRVLGADPARSAFAIEWLPGTSPAGALAEPWCDAAAMEAVGRGLAELHRQPGTGLATLTPAVQAAALRRRAGWLDRLDPGLEGRAGELALRLGERLARERGDVVPLHRDFIPAHVLLQDSGVAIVDLDEARLGFPTVDLGVFVASLERHAMLGKLGRDRCAVLRGAFLEGYAEHAGRTVGERALDTQIAAALLKRAPGAFRRREPGWRARIRAIVALAERLTDARG
jgi:hypothetical protein